MADIRIKDLATTATTTASDDFMAVDGTTNGTRKLSANAPSFLGNITSGGVIADQGGTIAAQRNGLAPAQGLAFDGTAGATVANVSAFGTGDFTVSAKVRLDSLTASATAAIFGGSGNGFALTVFNSAGSYLIYPRIVYGSAITSVAAISLGLTANITYTRSSATTGKIYLNGILADTVTDANNYTGVVAAIGSNSAAAEWFWNGVIAPVAIENRALSAAEVLALYQSGAVASADYNTASNTALNTSTIANYAPFPYAVFTGASASGFVASATGISYASSAPVFSVIKGCRYRVNITLSSVSGQLPSMLLGQLGVVNLSSITELVSGVNTIEFTATATNANAVVIFTNSTVGAFTASSITVTRLGALLAPDSAQVGAGLAWYDTSGNAANITLPATGVSWSLPTSGKAFSLSLASTTAGASNAGALVVAGGISAGNTGSAASYFGGAVTVGGNFIVGGTVASPSRISIKQTSDSGSAGFQIENFGSTNAWYLQIGSDQNFYLKYNNVPIGQFNSATGVYTPLSDSRVKKDIAEISLGLYAISKLRPVEYRMIENSDDSTKNFGFIAQEVLEILPSSVSKMNGGMYGLDKSEMIPVIVKALQELNANLVAELQSVRQRLTVLESK